MGRRKLALELIRNEKARRITYEKRKKNMMKKAQELSTLCGVDTCMIIYGPPGSATATEPEIWPPSPEKVKQILERYISKGGDSRGKRMVGLPEFFMTKTRKVDAKLAKARLANWEAKYPVSEALIEGLSDEDMRSLLGSLGNKLKATKARLALMKEEVMRRSSSHTYETLKSHHVLHSPYFFVDEEAVPIGAALHSAVAMSYLDEHADAVGACPDYGFPQKLQPM